MVTLTLDNMCNDMYTYMHYGPVYMCRELSVAQHVVNYIINL